jgi:hypothetical protein
MAAVSPAENRCTGADVSTSSTDIPSDTAIRLQEIVGPGVTSGARNHTTSRPAASVSKVTRTCPTARFNSTGPENSSAMRWRTTHAVPRIGCPANAISRAGVKIRTGYPPSSARAAPTKVVSE